MSRVYTEQEQEALEANLNFSALAMNGPSLQGLVTLFLSTPNYPADLPSNLWGLAKGVWRAFKEIKAFVEKKKAIEILTFIVDAIVYAVRHWHEINESN